jgi:ribosomal protein L4
MLVNTQLRQNKIRSSWWWKKTIKKGTGNARAGSRRSPLWVGGGYFRTKPYCFKKVNKKKKISYFIGFIFKKKDLFSLTKILSNLM